MVDKIKNIIIAIIIYALLGVMGVLLLPYASRSKEKCLRVIRLYCDVVFWILKKFYNIKILVKGHVPDDGASIVCSKHQSFLDVLILLKALPEPKFIMKSELSWIPVLSTYARKIGCFNVKRNDKARSWHALKEAINKEAENQSGQLVIYPEGTRTKPGQEVKYKKGVLVLFSNLKRPLYLVSTNAGVAWSKNGRFKDNATAIINFVEKINYSKKEGLHLDYIKENIERDSLKLYNEEAS
ncbi:MAG: 1-acyl-sn-glycerol-3-phosphate acyltransferase [Paracoccaceae bacterium]|nr:MAG: 1-acyl-sn-glycerol-3-phosphate acyltransferase [Paracoccaceae bacterium]